MTDRTLTICQQVDNLGIDRNLLYEICGGLDNIKELMDISYETIENYANIEEFKKHSIDCIHFSIKRVLQLSYIFDNEFKKTMQAWEALKNQMESQEFPA